MNMWIRHAIDLANEAAQRADAPISDLTAAFKAEYAALPDAFKPQAVESLRQHAAHANSAGDRVAALRALEWLVTA